MSVPKPYLVEVEWEDASSLGNWRPRDTSVRDSTLANCRTAGYLLHRDAKRVVIAQNTDSEDKYADTMAIPVKSVTRIRRLK